MFSHCRAQNGLIFFASAAKSTRAYLNFTFRIQIPHGFHNRMILLQNKTKYGLIGTKGLTFTLEQKLVAPLYTLELRVRWLCWIEVHGVECCQL